MVIVFLQHWRSLVAFESKHMHFRAIINYKWDIYTKKKIWWQNENSSRFLELNKM